MPRLIKVLPYIVRYVALDLIALPLLALLSTALWSMNTSDQPNLDSVGYPDISEGPYFVFANQVHLLPVRLQFHILFSLQEVYLQNLKRFFLAHHPTQRTPYTAKDMTQMGFLPKSKLARASHRYEHSEMPYNHHTYVKTMTWSASHAMQVKEEVQRLHPGHSPQEGNQNLRRELAQWWTQRNEGSNSHKTHIDQMPPSTSSSPSVPWPDQVSGSYFPDAAHWSERCWDCDHYECVCDATSWRADPQRTRWMNGKRRRMLDHEYYNHCAQSEEAEEEDGLWYPSQTINWPLQVNVDGILYGTWGGRKSLPPDVMG